MLAGPVWLGGWQKSSDGPSRAWASDILESRLVSRALEAGISSWTSDGDRWDGRKTMQSCGRGWGKKRVNRRVVSMAFFSLLGRRRRENRTAITLWQHESNDMICQSTAFGRCTLHPVCIVLYCTHVVGQCSWHGGDWQLRSKTEEPCCVVLCAAMVSAMTGVRCQKFLIAGQQALDADPSGWPRGADWPMDVQRPARA